jgi:hypothetical protein
MYIINAARLEVQRRRHALERRELGHASHRPRAGGRGRLAGGGRLRADDGRVARLGQGVLLRLGWGHRGGAAGEGADVGQRALPPPPPPGHALWGKERWRREGERDEGRDERVGQRHVGGDKVV